MEKEKRDFRAPYDVDDTVKKHEKEGKFPNYSQALIDIVRKFARNEGQYGKIIIKKDQELKEKDQKIEELKEAVEMVVNAKSRKDRQPKIKCAYKMPDGTCGKFWLSRGKKMDVTNEDCDWCLEIQQLEKTEGAKLLRSPKRRKQTTSKIDKNTAKKEKKKPKEIYCYFVGRWVTLEFVNKHPANCKSCETRNVKGWAECLEKRHRLMNE